MTPWTGSRDDYEREHAALLAWKDERPHRHEWMLDTQRMMQVCACGDERRAPISAHPRYVRYGTRSDW